MDEGIQNRKVTGFIRHKVLRKAVLFRSFLILSALKVRI